MNIHEEKVCVLDETKKTAGSRKSCGSNVEIIFGRNISTKNTYQEQVYSNDEKKVNIQSFLNFMKKFTSFLPVWHRNEDGNFTLVDPKKEHSKNEKLISSKLYYDKSWLERERNPHKTYDKLQFVRDILETRNLNEEELKKALEVCSFSLLMLQTKGRNGKISWYESNAKGTKRYNKIQQGKILDFVEKKRTEGKDCFFLTLTCDIKKYPSRAFAWENYLQEEVYRVTENLRKHYGAEYVATLESTTNGYPHIHMMLFFPHNTFPELKYYHNQQNIKKGRLFNMIKSTVNSEVFNLQAAKGKNLKWYLTKYIGKGIEEDVFSIFKKKEDWSKSDIKQVQEYVYLKAFNRRKLLMTRKNCKKSKIVQHEGDIFKEKGLESLADIFMQESLASVDRQGTEEDIKEQVSVLMSRIDEMSECHATKLRGYLTRLCTNSPSWNDVFIESMQFPDFVLRFDCIPYRNDDVSEKDMDNFSLHSRVMVNTRNFIEDFMKFVVNPASSDINRKEWVNFYADIWHRMLDKYDFSDDKQFLKAVFSTFCYYVEWILMKDKDYRAVLEQREDRTWIPKRQYINDRETNIHICESGPESYFSEKEIESRNKMEDEFGRFFDSPKLLPFTGKYIDSFRYTHYINW